MHILRNFYNRNRKTIFIVIFCIIVGYMIIRYLNNYYIEKAQKQAQDYNSSSSTQNTTAIVENQDFDLSGSKKSENTIKQDKDILDEFFEFCNKKEVSKAYNLLTDECKELKYPTLDDFKNSYFNSIFDTTKSYTIENWNGKTYRIKIQNDLLSTGKVSDNAFIEDYITVVTVNHSYKLNINSYIKRVNISKQSENEIATINVKSKDIYMDYEIYNITIKNNTDSKLLIDDLQKTNSIYLTENKGAKYAFANYELVKAQLEIISGGTIDVSIKFNHAYRSDKKIKTLTFSGIRKEINGEINTETEDAITINF